MVTPILPSRCEHCKDKLPITTPVTKIYSFRWNHTGTTFGRLTVVHFVGMAKKRSYWCCACVCGEYTLVTGPRLRNGDTQSCGCRRRGILGQRNFKHGLSRHPLFVTWTQMLQRCTNPHHSSFRRYGGRGIVVCERWQHSFVTFLADMGNPPEGTTLDRRDNDGPYSPENCRWATSAQQANNRTFNPTNPRRFLVYRGETHIIAEWSKIMGLPYKAILGRLGRGWDIEKTLTTPLRITKATRLAEAEE